MCYEGREDQRADTIEILDYQLTLVRRELIAECVVDV